MLPTLDRQIHVLLTYNSRIEGHLGLLTMHHLIESRSPTVPIVKQTAAVRSPNLRPDG
jgi:DNA-binding FrmR family transcriptional regulator